MEVVALRQEEANELERLETIIEKNLVSFYEIGTALLTIRDKRLYREYYDTFEAYCVASAFLLSGRQVLTCGSESVYKGIKEGSFKVTNYAYAHRVASIIQAIHRQIPIATNALFINALSRVCLVKDFNANRFIKNAIRHHASFTTRATLDDYLDLIESVYNDHARYGRLPLKFMANEASQNRSASNLRK